MFFIRISVITCQEADMKLLFTQLFLENALKNLMCYFHSLPETLSQFV